MEYVLENELLKVTVTTWGAQVKSVIRKCDGAEHMWQADPKVWGYHAPILFPYTGKLKDGKHICKGKEFASPAQHGFARTSEHTLFFQNKQTIVLQLTDSDETLAVWPYRFRLLSAFTLEGDTLHHTLTVENRDEETMPFGIGYHPAFAIPFDGSHTAEDYELRFDKTESPICLATAPRGLISGETYFLGSNIQTIPVEKGMFDKDSHCMVGLSSHTLGLYEKGSGRGVVCDISEFPYTLIWSKPGVPPFICIEPWNSLPSRECDGYEWEKKPAAAMLAPGESWSTTLRTSFVR